MKKKGFLIAFAHSMIHLSTSYTLNSSQCVALLPQALLEVVNDLFEEQTDLEKIVRKIMQRALTLLQCERCSVLLLEDIDSPVRRFVLLFNLRHR